MSGKIFNMGLSEEMVAAIIAANPTGGRFRTPPMVSNHNPLFRKRRDKDICEQYQAGKTAEEIAVGINLSRRWVKKILETNNIQKRDEVRKSRIDIIREELAKNTKREEIAKRLGVSRQRLHQIAKEAGL